jgi:hypothetical protein
MQHARMRRAGCRIGQDQFSHGSALPFLLFRQVSSYSSFLVRRGSGDGGRLSDVRYGPTEVDLLLFCFLFLGGGCHQKGYKPSPGSDETPAISVCHGLCINCHRISRRRTRHSTTKRDKKRGASLSTPKTATHDFLLKALIVRLARVRHKTRIHSPSRIRYNPNFCCCSWARFDVQYR